MFSRIKRFWKLSNKDPKIIERFESLTDEEMAQIPEIGDGNAVFFGEGTEQEFKEQELADKGLLAWYKRIQL